MTLASGLKLSDSPERDSASRCLAAKSPGVPASLSWEKFCDSSTGSLETAGLVPV